MGFAPASITGLVNRLERKGFARRVHDPDDRRLVRIERIPRRATLGSHRSFYGPRPTVARVLRELYDGELELILGFITETTRVQDDARQG